MTLSYVLPGAAALVLIWAILAYHGLAKARNRVDEAWSGVDVQLKRRHELVPALLEAMKRHAAEERPALARVVEARFRADSAIEPAEAVHAEAQLTDALATAREMAEGYPELQADGGFRALQHRLTGLDGEIEAARRVYNAAVEGYNTRVLFLPNRLIAGTMSFRTREAFANPHRGLTLTGP
jgi:LemA protein